MGRFTRPGWLHMYQSNMPVKNLLLSCQQPCLTLSNFVDQDKHVTTSQIITTLRCVFSSVPFLTTCRLSGGGKSLASALFILTNSGPCQLSSNCSAFNCSCSLFQTFAARFSGLHLKTSFIRPALQSTHHPLAIDNKIQCCSKCVSTMY